MIKRMTHGKRAMRRNKSLTALLMAIFILFNMIPMSAVTFAAGGQATVLAVENAPLLASIEVPFGTPIEDIVLPETVKAVIELPEDFDEETFIDVSFAEETDYLLVEIEQDEDFDEIVDSENDLYKLPNVNSFDEYSFRRYGVAEGYPLPEWYACDETGKITGVVADVAIETDTSNYFAEEAGMYVLPVSVVDSKCFISLYILLNVQEPTDETMDFAPSVISAVGDITLQASNGHIIITDSTEEGHHHIIQCTLNTVHTTHPAVSDANQTVYEMDYDDEVLTITGTNLNIQNNRFISIIADDHPINITIQDLYVTTVTDHYSVIYLGGTTGMATLNLTVLGTNTLRAGSDGAGIYVDKSDTLNIYGTGTLTVYGGNANDADHGGGAGIGGGWNSGTVGADGGTVNIGRKITDIGQTPETVTINAYGGAGIGAGNGTGGGAGIGGAGGGSNSSTGGAGGTLEAINIYGGTVNAYGGAADWTTNASAGGGGAGIGGGGCAGNNNKATTGAIKNIFIQYATVYAQGGKGGLQGQGGGGGAGIGGGGGGANGSPSDNIGYPPATQDPTLQNWTPKDPYLTIGGDLPFYTTVNAQGGAAGQNNAKTGSAPAYGSGGMRQINNIASGGGGVGRLIGNQAYTVVSPLQSYVAQTFNFGNWPDDKDKINDTAYPAGLYSAGYGIGATTWNVNNSNAGKPTLFTYAFMPQDLYYTIEVNVKGLNFNYPADQYDMKDVIVTLQSTDGGKISSSTFNEITGIYTFYVLAGHTYIATAPTFTLNGNVQTAILYLSPPILGGTSQVAHTGTNYGGEAFPTTLTNAVGTITSISANQNLTLWLYTGTGIIAYIPVGIFNLVHEYTKYGAALNDTINGFNHPNNGGHVNAPSIGFDVPTGEALVTGSPGSYIINPGALYFSNSTATLLTEAEARAIVLALANGAVTVTAKPAVGDLTDNQKIVNSVLAEHRPGREFNQLLLLNIAPATGTATLQSLYALISPITVHTDLYMTWKIYRYSLRYDSNGADNYLPGVPADNALHPQLDFITDKLGATTRSDAYVEGGYYYEYGSQINLLGIYDTNGYPINDTVDGEYKDFFSGDFPKKAGYYAYGWNTKADGTGTAYYRHQIFTITEDAILYLQWFPTPTVLSFTKVAQEDLSKVLEGAEFTLYAYIGEKQTIPVPFPIDPSAAPLVTQANIDILWEVYATAESDENGVVSLGTIANGNYILVETKAPTGYILPQAQVVLQFEAGKTPKMTSVGGSDLMMAIGMSGVVNVANERNIVIPGTGGIGTIIFTIGGIALIGGSLLLLLLSRKKKKAVNTTPPPQAH